MSQELHYTSLPRGLKPGSRGFCTVAMTPQLPGPLFERLENLSGYQPVFPPHDPSAPLNPVHFSHVRFSLAGRPLSILSRVGPAGLDYSGRTNKYAHHVVLDGDERPEGGPAWLLGRPGFMQSVWDGEPRLLDAGRPVPRGDHPGGVAATWAATTGDAGWAGVLAEAFLTDPRRPAFLLFRPGMDLLPLVAEAIALLPVSRRWDVEFGTYLTQAPRGVNYTWRGVLEGSPEAVAARRLPGALVIDLCGPPRRAEGGPLVHAARSGEPFERTEASSAPMSADRAHPPAGKATRPFPVAGTTPPERPASVPGHSELMPELAARLSPMKGRPNSREIAPRPGRTGWLIAGILVACLVPLALGGRFLRGPIMELLGVNSAVREKVTKNQKIVEEKKQQKEQAERDREKASLAAVPESRMEPVPRAAPVVASKPAEPKKNPEKHDSKRPSPPPVAQAPPSTTVQPLFCHLEEPVSGVGGTFEQKPIKLDDGLLPVKSLELLGYKDLEPTPVLGGLEVTVPSRVSGLGLMEARSRKLASFRASANGLIEFRWAEMRPNEMRAERDILRGGILKICPGDGKPRYCILREKPSISSDRREFEERLDSERSRHGSYTFYSWDPLNLYYDKFHSLKITDCFLQQGKGGKPPELREKDDSWVAEYEGEPLLTVKLCKFGFQKDGHTPKLFVKAGKGEDIFVRRVVTRKSSIEVSETNDLHGSRADEGSIVVLKLLDDNPRNLKARIEWAEVDKGKAEQKLNDAEREDEKPVLRGRIRELTRSLRRMRALASLFESSISLKVAWNIDEAKLELANMEVLKFTSTTPIAAP